MLQIRIYATFILIAGVIAPVVALPMPSPPQAGSSKDGSHPIANPPSPNSPHSDFFFNIEGINTDGGHDVRYDQHHDTSSIYSDVHMEAPYTEFDSSKPIKYEHVNPFDIPRTPPRINPLSSQIREDESHKDISIPPSRSSSTSEQAAGPQSPLHHGQTLPPTGNTGSPPRIPFKDKGKEREHTISSDSDSEDESLKPLPELGSVCPECGMKSATGRIDHVQRHINTLRDEAHVNSPYRQTVEKHPCSFPGCNKSFYRLDSLKRHEENLSLHRAPKLEEAPSSPQHSASSSPSNSPTHEPSVPNEKGKASTSRRSARARNAAAEKAKKAAKAAKIRSGVQAGPSKSKK